MTADHSHYAEWDAAYVLGALAPSERREFEDHLEDCEKCQAAVAELSGMPGLLGRLDVERAFAMADPEEAAGSLPLEPAVDTHLDLVARIRARERSQRLRRRLGMLGGLAAAAVLASVLTLVTPQLFAPPPPLTAGNTLVPVSDTTPIEGMVTLTDESWGTRIDLECSYRSTPQTYGAVEYSLWAVGRDGSEQALSTWKAGPNETVTVSAGTALSFGDIRDVELRSADGSRTLLFAPFD